MGDKEQRAFQLSFNGFLKVDFQGSRVTSDGGLLLVRELDERLGLGKLIDEHLTDSRQGSNKKFPLADLVRQSVYSRLAGYEDLNDAVRVSADPTFRLLGSKKNWDRGGALTSRRQSFEAELLASEENLLGLMAVNRELVAQAEAQDQSERVVLDMDSTESPVHGQQEGSAYNGHFESTCYHPLLLFNQHGDCLAAKLRAGNVSSAEDWDELLLPEIERQQAEGKHVTLRADAAFAKPEIYAKAVEVLTQATELNPVPEAWENLAKALAVSSQFDQAIDTFVDKTKVDPSSTLFRLLLGEAYWNRSSFQDALEQFQLAAKLSPASARAHFWTGYAQQLLGNPTTAKHSLETALKLDPGHTLANLTMGHLLADEGNGQQAIRFLERVSQEKPDDFEVRLKLAQVFLDLERFDQALAQLKTAEWLAPENKRVFYLLARLYKATDQAERARRALATFSKLEAAELEKKRLQNVPYITPR